MKLIYDNIDTVIKDFLKKYHDKNDSIKKWIDTQAREEILKRFVITNKKDFNKYVILLHKEFETVIDDIVNYFTYLYPKDLSKIHKLTVSKAYNASIEFAKENEEEFMIDKGKELSIKDIKNSEIKKIINLLKKNKLTFKYGSISDNQNLIDVFKMDGDKIVSKLDPLPFGPVGFLTIDGITVIKEFYLSTAAQLKTTYYLTTEVIVTGRLFPHIGDKELIIHTLVNAWASELHDTREMIDKLDIPAHFRKLESPLYRGLTISPKAFKKLQNNESITLHNLPYSSWTHLLEEARNFIHSNKSGIVIKQENIKVKDILINISAFEDECFGTNFIETKSEEEIIVKNSPELLTVYPDMVVLGKGLTHKGTSKDIQDFKNLRIKASDDSDEETLDEISSLIRQGKIDWEYGINKPLSNVELWWMTSYSFRKDKKGYLPTKSYGVFIYKNFTVLQNIYFESSTPDYEYYAVKDAKVIFKKKLDKFTKNDLKLQGLLFKWGDKCSDKIGEQIEKLGILDKYKKVSNIVLYRGLKLSLPAMKNLSENKPVHLDNRKYSSWSTSIEATKRFGPVTIKYSPSKEDILININLFSDTVFGNVEIYFHHIENEIILKNSPEMLIVHPDQVVKEQL